jgi:hypothetical protein
MDWSLVLTFFFCCTSYFPNSQFEVHEIAICSVVLRHLGWTEIWYRRSFSVACLTSSLSTLWVLPPLVSVFILQLETGEPLTNVADFSQVLSDCFG